MEHNGVIGRFGRPGRRWRGGFLTLLVGLFVTACAGDSAESRTAESEPAAQAAAPAAQPVMTLSADEAAALATEGEGLFQSKGCVACHTIGGGRLTGPDLAGVTERREANWIFAMIQNPDSMVKNDATARQLFAEYMTPMLPMPVTEREVRALYEYLRAQNQ